MNFPQFFKERSQDLPYSYYDSGQFYFSNAKNWIDKKNIFKNSFFLEIEEDKIVDIDDMNDLKIAKKFLKKIMTYISKKFILENKLNIKTIFEKINFQQNLNHKNYILTKTLYTMISPGTELSAFMGMDTLRPIKKYPRLMGYINFSKVIKVGDNITDVNVGDIIYSDNCHQSYNLINQDDFF